MLAASPLKCLTGSRGGRDPVNQEPDWSLPQGSSRWEEAWGCDPGLCGELWACPLDPRSWLKDGKGVKAFLAEQATGQGVSGNTKKFREAGVQGSGWGGAQKQGRGRRGPGSWQKGRRLWPWH